MVRIENIMVEPVKVEAYPHPQEARGSGKGVGGIAVWGVIGIVLVVGLGLAASWRSGHFAIGLGFREGADWLEKFAQ